MKKFSLVATVAVSALMLTACSRGKSGDETSTGKKVSKVESFSKNLQSGTWWSECDGEGHRFSMEFMAADNLVNINKQTFRNNDCTSQPDRTAPERLEVYKVSQVDGNSAQLQFFKAEQQAYGQHDFTNVAGAAKQATTATIDGDTLTFVGLFNEVNPLVKWVRASK